MPQEYWSILADLQTAAGADFQARITAVDGVKKTRLDIASGTEAADIKQLVEQASLQVRSVEAKPVRRNPYAPFTTSTLQQEASRKLGFAAARTMQIAQRLYEGVSVGGETTGLITYMRTDGVEIAPEAISPIRNMIESEYGKNYLPEKPRHYTVKAKNAQEAHEAIRPTDISRHPNKMAQYLDDEQLKLYTLIGAAHWPARWNRPSWNAPPLTSPQQAAHAAPNCAPQVRWSALMASLRFIPNPKMMTMTRMAIVCRR